MVTWSLSKTPQGLRVEYTVRNPHPTKIWVCDKQVVPARVDGSWALTDRATVSGDGADPTLVVFTLGPRGNDLEVDELYKPTWAELEPNAARTGSFVVPLPLRSWSPEGRMKPLPATLERARLDIYFLPKEPTGWDTLTSSHAAPIRVPSSYTSLDTFSSSTLALPE